MTTRIGQFIVRQSKNFLKRAKPGPVRKQELFRTIDEAKALDVELSRWCQSVPAEWLPRIVYSSTGESFLTYQDVLTGCLWNDYRSVRITLQTALEDLCAKAVSVSDASDEITVDAITRTKFPPADVIRDLISDICKSIPFTMGDIDVSGKVTTQQHHHDSTSNGNSNRNRNINSNSGSSSGSRGSSGGHTHSYSSPRIRAIEGYELLWPLWQTCISRFSTPRQRTLAQETLNRLGTEFGIKLAFALAGEGSTWSDET